MRYSYTKHCNNNSKHIKLHIYFAQIVVLTRELDNGLSFVSDPLQGIYNCTVVGEGSTVWTGSAFDCPDSNDSIILRHHQFSTDNTTAQGMCNNGSIIGRGVSVDGDCFTSQLYVKFSVTLNLEGENVICIYKNGSHELIVGNTTIRFGMILS